MHIRPATSQDLSVCLALDHTYTTDHVWQMETHSENGLHITTFRLAPLPREVRVSYPLTTEALLASWQRRDEFFVAETEMGICGYVTMSVQAEHSTVRIGDLVVGAPHRRQGVGTALLWAAARWGREHALSRLIVELPTKNYPATRFCQSRNLAFCGYNEHYWPNQDIVLFFGQSLGQSLR